MAYLFDAVVLYHKFSDHLRVVLEWRVLLSCGSSDVYIVDRILGSGFGWKEYISHLYTLQDRGSSCGDCVVGIELTDRFPKVN